MTIEENRREIFESIAKGFHMEIERWGDGYYFVDTQNAWEIFNAALDSVLIEFPEKFLDDHGGAVHDAKIYDGAIDECRAAIGSTGLGIKFK